MTPDEKRGIGHLLLRVVYFTLIFSFLALATGYSAEAASIKPARWVTKSGIVVLFVERHSLPTVHLQLVIRAGSVLDPKGREGTANLTASLLDEGTATRSSQQIAGEIDFIGASLSASAGSDATSISLSVLKKDLSTGMTLLADVLLHPAFPDKELERVRQQIVGGLIAEEDEPNVVAGKIWRKLVFGEHPYNHPAEGDRESLPRITHDGLLAFHQQYYQPGQSILAVVGDLKRSEVEQLIARHLGNWKNNVTLERVSPPVPQPAAAAVKLIDKELTQATILMGHLGLPRNHPDYYAVVVMNYILGGGGFGSRLMNEIRDNRGLVYGISSGFSPMKASGSFTISLQTKNTTANRAIEETLALVTQFQKEGATAQELDEAKAYLIGSFPLRLDTNAKLVGLLASIELYELGLEYFDQYPKLIAAISLEDVKQAATRYVHPNHMVLVVVAKQDEAKIKVSSEDAPR